MAHLVQLTFLADSLWASSIKVYLSAAQSLHIEHGFPGPLLNCLRLHRVVRGIKHVQGAVWSTHLPVTDSIMLLTFKSLDLKLSDHCLFWAACRLAYFGFLQASKFTVSNLKSFSPSCHLTLKDVFFDLLVTPSLLRVNIKVSKIDPFRRGPAIHIGGGKRNSNLANCCRARCSLYGFERS